MQLARRKDAFDDLDIGLAAITYDAREILAAFHAEQDLDYPLLQDVAAANVNAYRVRNLAYGPDDGNYGVPHPGIVWIGAEGRVRAKWAVPGYRDRPPFDEVLAELRRQLER